MRKWIDSLVGRVSLRSRVRQTILSLDEEFQAHLEESADDLVESGVSPAEAHAEAIRRFGDLSVMRASSLSEHVIRPYRKLVYVLGVLLLGMSVALVLSLYNANSSFSGQNELKRVNHELAELRARMATSGDRITIPMAQDIRFVSVEGAVKNPQVWTFGRRDDVTVGDLLHRSGWLTSEASGQVVAVRVVNGEPERVFRIDTTGGKLPPELDTVVDASYLIYAEPSSLAYEKGTRPTTARLVDLSLPE